MPVRLESFRGHVVTPEHAAAVVSPPYDALQPEQRRELAEHPDSFLGVLPPGDERHLELRLALCRTRLDDLLARGRYRSLDEPVLAVLRVDDGHTRATGVVGDLPASAFTDGTVRPHEQVGPRRVRALTRHLEVVGSVSSPVCVAHRPDPVLAGLLDGITHGPAYLAIGDAFGSLRLWLVEDPAAQARLADAVATTTDWLIADGHHRAAAAQPVGRVLSVLMPDDQLVVRAFHRRERVQHPDRTDALLRAAGLEVAELDGGPRTDGHADPGLPATTADLDPAAVPRRAGEVTITDGRRWWRATLPQPASDDPVAWLDVTRAEQAVLRPLLGTVGAEGTDLSTRRVVPISPTVARVTLVGDSEVAVLLYPPDIAEIRRVVAVGRTMPPKTTYVAPKQRSGVLLVPR